MELYTELFIYSAIQWRGKGVHWLTSLHCALVDFPVTLIRLMQLCVIYSVVQWSTRVHWLNRHGAMLFQAYLIFVIFCTRARFFKPKFYTQKRVN